MAYFIPLGVQKRLLRYALSKLELLNTNQLDLEKLDIALGKNSTVSLKDVEINTEVTLHLLHSKSGSMLTTFVAEIDSITTFARTNTILACTSFAVASHHTC